MIEPSDVLSKRAALKGHEMADLSRATPRPWRVEQKYDWSRFRSIRASNDIQVADSVESDDAVLIVQAVNEREELLAIREAARALIRHAKIENCASDRIFVSKERAYALNMALAKAAAAAEG